MKNLILQFVSGREWDLPFKEAFLENTRQLRKNYLSPFHSADEGFFKHKVAIITGASSGIGRAISGELAGRGARVVLAARSEAKLEALAAEIRKKGGSALSVKTDVTDESQCHRLIDQTIRTFGKIDFLINNAGISMRASFSEVEMDVLKQVMDTNFWGTVYCTRYALPHILQRAGSITGISSICGITPLPGRTGYVASKHAMDGFMETIRVENTHKGLHVMLVHPGFTSSNIRNLALNRYGLPQEETPLEEDKLMPAEHVAHEVAEGILHKKRDITLTTEGKMITWLYRRVPLIAEKLIYREMKKEIGSPV